MRMILKHLKRKMNNKKLGKKGEWQICDNVLNNDLFDDNLQW